MPDPTPLPAVDIMPGDRVSVYPPARITGAAHPLDATVRLQVTAVTPAPDGTAAVSGRPLHLASGHYGGQDPISLTVRAGQHSAAIRAGDTVTHPLNAGQRADVVAVHLRFDGRADAELLHPDGAVTVTSIDDLTLHTRTTEPLLPQACARPHRPDAPCSRCDAARQAVRARCTQLRCTSWAERLVTWTGSHSHFHYSAPFCLPHAAETTGWPAARSVPLSRGTYTLLPAGQPVQVSTCRYCGHPLYRSTDDPTGARPWLSVLGDVSSTGCTGPDLTSPRTSGQHRPAPTVAMRLYAITAANCGTAHNGHPTSDCPARTTRA